MDVSVLLHNIRSAHNVGSIFRTCDAAGVSRVYLTGYTPAPTDRFGRAQKDIAKTALGAERTVAWEYHKNPLSLIVKLKKDGKRIVGIEQDERAQNYRSLTLKKQIVFLLGNEVRGLSKQLRDACDTIVEIPMRGKKESLNVSVAAGIVLFASI